MKCILHAKCAAPDNIWKGAHCLDLEFGNDTREVVEPGTFSALLAPAGVVHPSRIAS